MKFVVLFVVGVFASQTSFTADPNDAMNQLSMLMAGSQMALGKAQRHHQKLVDKTRKVVVKNFDDEAETFGTHLGAHAISLKKAEEILIKAIGEAQAGLAEEEKAPPKADDWEDPGVAERARLNAQISAANRTLQHMSRAHERALHEAEDDASQAFEDAGMKLSMKLGDLTEDSEKAKQHVVERTERMSQTESAAKTEKVTAPGKTQQARLQWFETELKSAQKASKDATEHAKKTFATFLAKEIKQVEIDSDKVLTDLAAAQQKEIAKVLKHQPTLAPLKLGGDVHHSSAQRVHPQSLSGQTKVGMKPSSGPKAVVSTTMQKLQKK